ncbi:hypothetical protein LX87_04698 [Larkinella arboricola]|uniref:Uncharacterized protein n=1 Tax=Larkinella arboricola TaxID=643671 RepID=A0A327WR80_LARAB|nr:hypothetical protein [Larkinella arboricola]RAJ93186.1 hypothetical protein LX87_04698 [Larkinella arboricola]
MITQLNIVGGVCILLALLHAVFPSYFHWKQELKALSLLNRQLMYVHTFFIVLTVFFIGLLCLTAAKDLVTTRLGNRIALGLAIFWALRLWVQFFGYSAQLWRGKPLETVVHVVFSLLWLYFTAIFFMVFWSGWKLYPFAH